MEYIFEKAKPYELEAIFGLYRQRIEWMNKTGIAQWNAADYLEIYPPEYYKTQLGLDHLYVLLRKTDRTVAGAAVLLQSDERWPDGAEQTAYYIHNLVTSESDPGAGKVMLAEIEKLAVSHAKQFLRLDCAADNTFLNDYYASLGYAPAGTCEDGPYIGNRREKKLPVQTCGV